MATFRQESGIADARRFASAASFDIQKLRDDSVEAQALKNLLSAVESLITTIDDDESGATE
jgi:hypothetical protein